MQNARARGSIVPAAPCSVPTGIGVNGTGGLTY
jgi:hypothetical protein